MPNLTDLLNEKYNVHGENIADALSQAAGIHTDNIADGILALAAKTSTPVYSPKLAGTFGFGNTSTTFSQPTSTPDDSELESEDY